MPAVPTTSTGPTPPAAPEKARSERSPRDMALSLVVLLVPIALILGFYRLVLDGDEPIAIDPRPAIAEAQTAAIFSVAEPVGLGADWAVATATFRRTEDGATLRIGYVDPDKRPVQLVESSIASEKLIPVELGPTAAPGGTVRAGTRIWQRYDARKGESALVLLEKGRTIVVVGATEPQRLETLAASLT